MSRIGKQPIKVPNGVTIEQKNDIISIKGSKGELKKAIPKKIKIEVKENEILVTRTEDTKEARMLHGLMRSLLANMVEGVTKGFEKTFKIFVI